MQLAKSCRARRAPEKERVRRDEEEEEEKKGKKKKRHKRRERNKEQGVPPSQHRLLPLGIPCVSPRALRDGSHTKTMTVGPRAAVTTSLAYRLSLSSCSRSYSSPQGSHKLTVFLLLSCFLFAPFLPRALLSSSSSSSSDSHFSSALFEV